MLDSFAISNLIGENLSLKDRIIVNQIPSAQSHLATLLEAMQGNRVVLITYCGFNKKRSYTYNPQIQISAESETKRSIFREKDKTKRSKKESAQHSKSRNKSFVMTSVSAL